MRVVGGGRHETNQQLGDLFERQPLSRGQKRSMHRISKHTVGRLDRRIAWCQVEMHGLMGSWKCSNSWQAAMPGGTING